MARQRTLDRSFTGMQMLLDALQRRELLADRSKDRALERKALDLQFEQLRQQGKITEAQQKLQMTQLELEGAQLEGNMELRKSQFALEAAERRDRMRRENRQFALQEAGLRLENIRTMETIRANMARETLQRIEQNNQAISHGLAIAEEAFNTMDRTGQSMDLQRASMLSTFFDFDENNQVKGIKKPFQDFFDQFGRRYNLESPEEVADQFVTMLADTYKEHQDAKPYAGDQQLIMDTVNDVFGQLARGDKEAGIRPIEAGAAAVQQAIPWQKFWSKDGLPGYVENQRVYGRAESLRGSAMEDVMSRHAVVRGELGAVLKGSRTGLTPDQAGSISWNFRQGMDMYSDGTPASLGTYGTTALGAESLNALLNDAKVDGQTGRNPWGFQSQESASAVEAAKGTAGTLPGGEDPSLNSPPGGAPSLREVMAAPTAQDTGGRDDRFMQSQLDPGMRRPESPDLIQRAGEWVFRGLTKDFQRTMTIDDAFGDPKGEAEISSFSNRLRKVYAAQPDTTIAP